MDLLLGSIQDSGCSTIAELGLHKKNISCIAPGTQNSKMAVYLCPLHFEVCASTQDPRSKPWALSMGRESEILMSPVYTIFQTRHHTSNPTFKQEKILRAQIWGPCAQPKTCNPLRPLTKHYALIIPSVYVVRKTKNPTEIADTRCVSNKLVTPRVLDLLPPSCESRWGSAQASGATEYRVDWARKHAGFLNYLMYVY